MESTQQVGLACAAGSDMTSYVSCFEVCGGSDSATRFWQLGSGNRTLA